MNEEIYTVTGEELELDLPKLGVIYFNYEFTWQLEDHGIGAYEFWGAKGIDQNVRPTIQEITLTSVNKDFDYGEADLSEALALGEKYIDDNIEAISRKLEDKIECPDEPDYPDPELDLL